MPFCSSRPSSTSLASSEVESNFFWTKRRSEAITGLIDREVNRSEFECCLQVSPALGISMTVTGFELKTRRLDWIIPKFLTRLKNVNQMPVRI